MGQRTPGSSLLAGGASVSDVLGTVALPLRPRALPRLRTELDRATPFDSDTIEVSLSLDALPEGARASIAASHLVLRDGPLPGEARLHGAAQDLASLAADASDAARPALRALLAAHVNAVRPPGCPRLMGILNLTPDSFSDGGSYATPADAFARAGEMARSGASYLDVGGESTRPGSDGVSEAEELERILPVLEGLRDSGLPPVSVDTTKAAVARAALAHGAVMVNDVSAGRHDPEMLSTIAASDADYVLMHMAGTPRDMQERPSYRDVVGEVTEHLRGRAAACIDQGIDAERLWVDPGIGFGKRLEDNLALIRGLPQLRSLGLPILLGVSRKRFLGALSGTADAAQRDLETVAAQSAGVLFGADMLRVHDVAMAARGVRVASALASHP